MFKKSTKKGSFRKRKVSDEEVAEPEDNENLDKLKVAKLKRELLQEAFFYLENLTIFFAEFIIRTNSRIPIPSEREVRSTLGLGSFLIL